MTHKEEAELIIEHLCVRRPDLMALNSVEEAAVALARSVAYGDEPVTAEWLQSILGEGVDGAYWAVDGSVAWCRACGETYITHRGSEYRVDNRTQAEVLGLLKWLKVEVA